MKYKIILYGFLAAMITSCSSAYKATQTPDDVYYSPASVQKQNRNEDKYEDYVSSDDDRYLRMKIRDRQRWSSLDDYSYWNDSRYVPTLSYDYYHTNWYNPYAWNNWYSPYSYSTYSGSVFGYYGSYYPSYNPYGYSPYGYSPYGSNVYITKYPSRVIQNNVNRPNLNGYSNNSYSNSNYSGRQGLGSTLRRVFTPSNDNNSNYSNRNSTNNNNTYTAPQRTYTPSSSGSSSSSSAGSVSRPARSPRN